MVRNWAITVGINKYNNLQELNYAKRDAELMWEFFADEAGFDEIFLFTDDSPQIPASPSPISTVPTYGNLRRFLRVQFDEPLLGPGDNLWFFFAGHGEYYAGCDYLMLSDTDPGDILNTALPTRYVVDRLRQCGADNVILLLDACRDEAHSRGGLNFGNERHQGVITLFSCSPREKSWELEEFEQGSFTKAVLEGLRIQGEGNCATVERLHQYLEHRVPELNQSYSKPLQTPYLRAEPPYKVHFILRNQYSTLKDAEPLKKLALTAEAEEDYSLAEQLWIRVSAVSPADMEVFRAIKRIANRQSLITSGEDQDSNISGSSSYSGDRSTSSVSVPEKQDSKIKGSEFQIAQPYLEVWRSPDGTIFRKIPAGEFMMGATKYPDERPVHKVKIIEPFYLSSTLVTNAQFLEFCRATNYSGGHKNFLLHLRKDFFAEEWKDPRSPIVFISWNDAKEYMLWRSEKDDCDYRLPTEAQWEYACRAGTRTVYPWGNLFSQELLNSNQIYDHPTPVGLYPHNAWGLFDMLGNVWEWCEDIKDVASKEESVFFKYCSENFGDGCINPVNTDPNPIKSESVEDGLRVVRGGSFYGKTHNVRPANRRGQAQDSCPRAVGIRLVAYGV